MTRIKTITFAITSFKMSLCKHFFSKKLFCGVYFLFISICLLYGQQYPVQVNVIPIPPYAMRLGEYATTGEEKMRVQLLMTDLQEPMHQVKLRFTIEAGSNSVVMGGSTPFVSGWNNVTLMPGMPVWLSNIDMRALFDYNNLTGISYTQYSKPLPQGIYRYCFQALDAFNNRELSAKSCAMVYLQQYDPPMLNLPQRAEKVMKQGAFQNILFQWMPRQLAPSTKYIFTLKEIWDRSIDATMSFLTSRTLYEETVLPNMLYYGMDKPWLMAGKRYAWQVKAISANPGLPNSSLPTDEDGVYRNNGLSEIYWFDYEENCNVPQFLTAKVVGRGRAEIRWSAPQSTSISNNTYKLQYRKKDGGVWTEQQTTQEIVNLTDLGDGIDYEYRVGSVCGSSGDEGYVYSGIQLFTLPTKEEEQQQYQCGVMAKIEIANQEPMKGTMGVNEVFTAGDFAVTVLSSEGSDGTYSGQGYVQVPYLGDTKLKVVFKEVRINTDKQLIGGMVETTYDPKEKNIISTNEIAEVANNSIDGVKAFIAKFDGSEEAVAKAKQMEVAIDSQIKVVEELIKAKNNSSMTTNQDVANLSSQQNTPTVNTNSVKEALEQKVKILEEKLAELKKHEAYVVSIEQMQEIFPNTKSGKLKEVMNVLNEYMSDFEINSDIRFVHFIAQVGHESGDFNNTLKAESCSYTGDRIKEIFGDVIITLSGKKYYKYGDLFEDHGCTDIATSNCKSHPCCALVSITISLDSLKVKSKYIKSCTLFDYVYSLRMGNGDFNSKEGFTYKGRGIIQLTGKESYTAFNNWYNKKYPNDKVNFVDNPDLILTDVKYAVLSALWEYSIDKSLNKFADKDDIDEITSRVNGGTNGADERKIILNKAKEIFNLN